MNREEVIRMAREAGFRTGELHMQDGSGSWTFVTPIGDGCIVELEKFAALVAAAERDACAQVCSDRAMRCELEANQAIENGERDESSALRSTAWQISVCADEIRARGVQPKD